MILEVADIRVRSGEQTEFEVAIRRGVESVIGKAQGFRGYKLNKGVESPDRYLLMIFWDTIENHIVDFRGSAAYGEWRAIVSPYFAAPPQVEHFMLLAKSDAG